MENRIPSWLLQLVSGLAAIALIAVAANQFISARNNSRSINSARTITISAEGKVASSPDMATVNGSVQAKANTAAEAQSQIAKGAQKVTDYLKTQGIKSEDVSTSDYSIYPLYDYSTPGRANVIIGYQANETLSVKVRDTSKLGTVLDGMTKNGVEQISGVNYSFDNPDNFRAEAREKALANAKEKAQSLAKSAGVRLGKLVTFSESSYANPGPIYSERNMANGMGGDAVSQSILPPGQQSITAQISVTYEILP
jgi:uncharacterized protein